MHKPFQHGLVAEHELSQRLNHADALRAQVCHCVGDEVFVFRCRILSRILKDVDAAVDGTEGPCATAAGAAVHDDRSFPSIDGLIWSDIVVSAVVGVDDVAAVFDQGQHVGWVGGGAEVWPAGVLELGEFASGGGGMVGAGEEESSDDDVRGGRVGGRGRRVLV